MQLTAGSGSASDLQGSLGLRVSLRMGHPSYISSAELSVARELLVLLHHLQRAKLSSLCSPRELQLPQPWAQPG